MLQVKEVRKKLGGNNILNEMHMEVDDGVIYGLIGVNGAGKSTLLKIIAGVLKPDGGTVIMDDNNVYDEPSIKQQILLISDEPYYFYNATLFMMKEFYKVSYPDLDEELYINLIEKFKLDDQKPLDSFSKGMKRQAFLLLGIAIAPRYLLLDEAFDGLDPHMRLLFKRAISSRIEEKRMTVIISSHNLKEMEEICDRFGLLEGGHLITSGMMNDTLAEIHKIQLAFQEEIDSTWFDGLDMLSVKINSRIMNLVVRGNLETIIAHVKERNPVMMEVLPVNLEELFVFEMKHREGLK